MIAAPLPPPFGGIATYLQHAVPYLGKRGFPLQVLQPPAHRAGAGSTTAPELGLHTLALPGALQLAQYCRANQSTVLQLLRWYRSPLRGYPLDAVRKLFGTLAWLVAAERLCSGRKVDIIHAFDSPWEQGAAAVLLGQRFGARVALSLFGEMVPHDDELAVTGRRSEPYRSVSHSVLIKADRLTSMTEHCRQQVGSVGVDPRSLRLVRFVVGMGGFHPDVSGVTLRRRYAPETEVLLLFVGQLRPRKGPRVLIQAMPLVLAAYPAVRLLIVGPDHGSLSALRELALELGVSHAVTFAGAVADSELPAYYAASDLFLFPSLTPIECLGLSFVQAMFAGVPVIATRLAGASEVIRQGQDGFLVDPGDVAGLAEATKYVLGLTTEARREAGLRGRERVLNLYPEDEVLNDLENLYLDLAHIA